MFYQDRHFCFKVLIWLKAIPTFDVDWDRYFVIRSDQIFSTIKFRSESTVHYFIIAIRITKMLINHADQLRTLLTTSTLLCFLLGVLNCVSEKHSWTTELSMVFEQLFIFADETVSLLLFDIPSMHLIGCFTQHLSQLCRFFSQYEGGKSVDSSFGLRIVLVV